MKVDKKQLVGLRKERKTYGEIGDLFGVTKQYIQALCKDLGIKKGALPTKTPYSEKRRKYLLNNYKENKETGCWEWTRCKYPSGYGAMSFMCKRAYVHRVAYCLLKDPTFLVFQEGRNKEDSIHVCHSCDNPSCINPEHLWIGNPQENMKDRDSKQRGKNYTQKNKEV